MPCECVYCASESREGDRLTDSRVEVVGIGKVSRPDTLWMFNRQSIDSFWYCSIAALHYELKVKGVGRNCETVRMHAWPDGIWICEMLSAPSVETSLVSMELVTGIATLTNIVWISPCRT